MKSKKVEKLLTEYEGLKVTPLIIKGSGAQYLYWATLLMLVPAYGCLFSFMLTTDWTYFFWLMVSAVLGAAFHVMSVAKCNKYVENNAKFASHRGDMKLRWWAYSYESFIDEYRFNVMKTELGHQHLNHNDRIEDIINILEEEGTKLFNFNWKIVIILGAVLFPLIGEYVGFRYNLILQKRGADMGQLYNQLTVEGKPAASNVISQVSMDIANLIETTKWEGLGLILHLIPSMIFTGLSVWVLVVICEKWLLVRVKNRKELIRLLRLIKIDR
jgi:hypothetical protein